MAGSCGIAPLQPTKAHGNARAGPSHANSRQIIVCSTSSQTSCDKNGLPSKLLAGYGTNLRATHACTSRTKPFIEVFSFRLAES